MVIAVYIGAESEENKPEAKLRVCGKFVRELNFSKEKTRS